ncbi:hypothetical protein [Mycobacterium simiae]|uniref:Uncharacterized protein n=1 Tax=Mycobacterium simiae TaxID=1784 RepID=A0A1X0XIE0_MYCSI|nr:hypothetical protein [Mycobacterium simiae]ORJ52617.1 hypothetical protein B5M45_31000 [Mycobacterium simiae]
MLADTNFHWSRGQYQLRRRRAERDVRTAVLSSCSARRQPPEPTGFSGMMVDGLTALPLRPRSDGQARWPDSSWPQYRSSVTKNVGCGVVNSNFVAMENFVLAVADASLHPSVVDVNVGDNVENVNVA